jgi:hypothetical protein
MGIVLLTIFGYYSVRLLTSLRKGILEKGWRRVSLGAIFLLIGQIPFIASGIGPANYFAIFSYSETALRFIGIVFLTLGFKAQYEVWRPDKKDLNETIGTTASIER